MVGLTILSLTQLTEIKDALNKAKKAPFNRPSYAISSILEVLDLIVGVLDGVTHKNGIKNEIR
jgi:hypothetical protein